MTTDSSVHRCPGCGGWLYAARPCATCAILERRRHLGDALSLAALYATGALLVIAWWFG